MGYDALPREYRMKRQRTLAFVCVIVAGTLSGLGAVLAAEDLPASFTYPFAIAWLALMAWLFYATLRCSTVADLKAIHVRGMVRRRRLAWEDIQDIRAEVSLAGVVQSGAAGVLVHAYDRDGRKVLLPFFDDVHVDVEHELLVVRGAWEELRGVDWAPDPDATASIHRRDIRRAAVQAGFVAVCLAFVPLVVLALLPLFVEAPGWLASLANPFALLGLAALIFALTTLASYRRRLRSGS